MYVSSVRAWESLFEGISHIEASVVAAQRCLNLWVALDGDSLCGVSTSSGLEVDKAGAQKQLRLLRNALIHSDERVVRAKDPSARGVMLVPSNQGLSFDDAFLAWHDFKAILDATARRSFMLAKLRDATG